MTDTFYLGQIDYRLALVQRQPIPHDQVWLYERQKDIFAVCWGSPDGTIPPRPGSRRTPIHKFLRHLSYPLRLGFFQATSIKCILEIDIKIVLLDPVAYLQAGFHSTDNIQELKTALEDVLQGNSQQAANSVISLETPGLYSLIPPAARLLLPNTNLTDVLEGQPDLVQRNMEAYATLRQVQFSPNWLQCQESMRSRLVTELQDVKKRVQVVYQSFLTQKIGGDFRTHCHAALKEYLQTFWIRANPTIETIIAEIRGSNSTAIAAEELASLTATLSNTLVQQAITQVMQELGEQNDEEHEQSIHATAIAGERTQQRVEQIRELYAFAEQSHWQLRPDLAQVKEHIFIQCNNAYELTVVIPRNYPESSAMITAIRQQQARLSTQQVHAIVTPTLQASAHDLISLVDVVVSHL
ncbi:hypothetical protein KSF_038690 [Reticulibacter mediterranei]|uniref:Uncharacterized protein n=1 Tax=Reticulibacter mediterranei TaxID=2778369 RepID=A0A8J3IFV5_9CHLR|nr:hypothetical protein [Reticulibacter mediterranei]GHO93821.1 hypothetical protein KSF_038690 [Reticulibacter mediterranei]